jgi:prolyl-tRNA editing enzyme YbaK/EbsC (Cys-tRNA(Pro) deacylase)
VRTYEPLNYEAIGVNGLLKGLVAENTSPRTHRKCAQAAERLGAEEHRQAKSLAVKPPFRQPTPSCCCSFPWR